MRQRKQYTTISLPKELFNQIEELVKETGFRSATEFIIYLLRQTLGQIEKEKERLSQLISQKRSKAEIAKIKKRLKRLGYF